MRRAAVQVMSGVSLVVVGLSLRSSRHLSDAALGIQPVGVVAGETQTQRAAPVSAASARALTGPPATQHRAATRTSSPTAIPSARAARWSPARAVTSRHTTAARKPSPAPPPPPRPTTVTVNGSPADTQYGPVQVQIRLRGGHIISADAIEYPTDSSRDQEINSYAIPQLDDETVRADSAQIDTVSGATYTSDGYRASLQSALDAAHQAGAR